MVIGQLIELPGVQHCDALINVQAVDDDLRIPAIWLPRTIARKDGTVVIHCGLRPEPADHACGFHSVASCQFQSLRNPTFLRTGEMWAPPAFLGAIRGSLFFSQLPVTSHPAHIPFSSVSAARLMASVNTFNCSCVSFRSLLSMASLTPGITTAAYPVYSPGA